MSVYTRFLLVDGNRRSLATVQGFLASLGFSVEVATGRDDCVEKLRTFQPDFVVVGADASEEERIMATVAADHHLSVNPTVFVISDESPERVASRNGLPCSYCFQRPVRLDALMDRICMVAVLTEASRNRIEAEEIRYGDDRAW